MIETPFASLSAAAARELADASTFGRVDPGEVVFAEGEPGDSLILISSGLIAVQVVVDGGSPVTVALRGQGDMLGETALFASSQRRTATAIARTDAQLLSLDRAAFESLRQDHTEVADLFLRILAERAASLTHRLAEATQPPVQTLARRLLDLPPDVRGSQAVTAADLGGLTGLSDTRVGEALGELESRGCVEIVSEGLILDRPAIRALASLP